ncbi:ankyrin repeat domain-containing protein [Psychrobium sp. nBUS_13]|uniref:ankyrin repeat domain-containing protein n=1 Tax=Psychrobium sp. nBUS_13 TaxID=3395319 RepID=UPI003EB80940
MLRFCVTFFLLAFSLQSFSFKKSYSINSKTAWSEPQLVLDNDISCAALLTDAKLKFYSKASWQTNYSSANTIPILNWKKLGGTELEELNAYDKNLFLTHFNHTRCGGACDRTQALVSKLPLSTTSRAELSEMAKTAPPAMSYEYTLALSNEKVPYLFVVGQYASYLNNLYVYRLTPDIKWEAACQINLHITTPSFNKEHSYFSAQKSVADLYRSILNISLGVGRCGGRKFEGHLESNLSNALELVLTRPWGVNNYSNTNNYTTIIQKLEEWALVGTSEQQALLSFKHQLERTQKELSMFFKQANNWTVSQSNTTAKHALESAITHGFRFNQNPFFSSHEEVALRHAILNRRPLAEIQKIDLSKVRKGHNQYNDSVINVAVSYPKALDFLLHSGFDPNVKNEFAKTPIMYAAQGNNVESVKLLIDAGAQVNTGTIIPWDKCSHNLETANITPLHYAVRYADKAVIKLLIANNASIYTNVEAGYRKTKEPPIDWLSKFDNKQLSVKDKLQVEKLLKIPSKEKLKKIVATLNLKGEQLFAKGNLVDAEVLFKEAIEIDTQNIKALNNYAITALKLKHMESSLKASYEVIKSKLANKRDIASAYFNTGLACKNVIYLNSGVRDYCDENLLEYFIKAYSMHPTTGRSNAIIKQFNKEPKRGISCHGNNSEFEVVNNSGNKMFYFLHTKKMYEAYSKQHPEFPENDVELTKQYSLKLNKGYSVSVLKGKKTMPKAQFIEEFCTIQ